MHVNTHSNTLPYHWCMPQSTVRKRKRFVENHFLHQQTNQPTDHPTKQPNHPNGIILRLAMECVLRSGERGEVTKTKAQHVYQKKKKLYLTTTTSSKTPSSQTCCCRPFFPNALTDIVALKIILI